ncbi:hypothetical protein XbC2_27 [Xanthomonas phage XbC2]|nr:hypothetical protein XbC2_27 [Xanthomonas phage XbC2]
MKKKYVVEYTEESLAHVEAKHMEDILGLAISTVLSFILVFC